MIRTTHNSFSMPDPFVSEEKRSKDDDSDDVFHFVSFLPINGKLYELDGLKPAPVCIGTIAEGQVGNFVVLPAFFKRDSNQLPIVRTFYVFFMRMQAWYEVLIDHLQGRIARFAGNSIKFNLMAMTANRLEAQKRELAEVEAKIASASESDEALEQQKASLSAAIADEQAAREKWKTENKRRRHNYVPFAMKLLVRSGRCRTASLPS